MTDDGPAVSSQPGATAPPHPPRTADAVAAWILYGLQLTGEALLGMFWLMSVMAGDSCGSVPDELKVCNGNYFATWWLTYAAVLAGAVLVTPIAILLAGRRQMVRWPWPALVIVLLIAATVGYGYMLSR